MVSEDLSMDPDPSVVHQFIISNTATNQMNFEDQDYAAFQSDGRNRNVFPQSPSVLPSIQSLRPQISRSIEFHQAPAESEDTQTCSGRHLMNLLEAANETDHQGQRLSLTLGSRLPSHVLVPTLQYRQRSLQQDILDSSYIISGRVRDVSGTGGEHVRDDNSFAGNTNASSSNSQNQSCSTSYEPESFVTVVGNSRYLKPAQSLLEEVVSLGGKAIDLGSDKFIRRLTRNGTRGALGLPPELQAELYGNKFPSSMKDEFHIRLTELVVLLDEVESRYEQYYHQMEEVVSSFEMIAGLGAAKSYTALALQAMSRHFCSLRDAIIAQIQIAKSQISKDLPRIRGGLSQLSLFDQETRHPQVTLQQLGMIQSQRQVWRPTRGLPENSVGILRAWLFEHFLHPYPNDSEKLMLASQTGLTKNQVSNWFINARVRLWKPMIEEMYKEEFEDSSMDSSPQESNKERGIGNESDTT